MLSEHRADFEVSFADESDAEQMSALHFSLFSDGWSKDDFISFLNMDSDLVLVAKDQVADSIIGFAVVRMVLDEAEILTIGISGDYQRSGAGTQLYERLEGALKQRNIVSLFLELRKGNTPAAGLYRKAGFKLVATRKDYYRSLCGAMREDALIMKKDL